MAKRKSILNWKQEVKNSFYRGSEMKFFVTLGGIEANLLYNTGSHPFCWSLDCQQLGIDNSLLDNNFEKAKGDAEWMLKWQLERLINGYEKALSKLTTDKKTKKRKK